MGARHGLIFAALLGVVPAPGVAAAAPPGTPLSFIDAFYRAYFADPAAARRRYVDSGSFYSRGLLALMEANRAACALTARQSSKCGWNADGDEFLHAQESDPALTLASSGFAASAAGAKAVDVRFRLFPNEPDSGRALRYVLVREDGQWRVDDVIDAAQGGYPRRNSLRHLIAAESRYALISAQDLAEQVNWVNIFVENEAVDTVAGFVAFPLTVCATDGACLPYVQNDPRLTTLVGTLKRVYLGKDTVRPAVPAGASGARHAAREGSTVSSGPFDYSFRRGQWWLTKVDLRRAPVRKQ